MQPEIGNDILQNRAEAGYLLAKKLETCRDSNTIVVGIPRGGVCVAAMVAQTLSLPLDVMICRKMAHPADRNLTIGSVSQEDIFLHDVDSIPQDYVCHQVALLRNAMEREQKMYYPNRKPLSLRDRQVILVDDFLSSPDAILACLRSIRNQAPLRIIVAVPIVAAEAARSVSALADDLIFIKMESSILSPSECYIDYPPIDEQHVKELLMASDRRRKLISEESPTDKK